MTEEIKYFLLGLIQGLAEFFPVSSSGHIILLSSVLDIVEKDPLLLSITVHFATTLSTIIVYRKKISQLLMGFFRHKDHHHISYLLKILVSSFPLIIVGLFFKNDVELVFNNSTRLVSIMLIITAGILIATKFFNTGEKKINYYHAFCMGIMQAIAILPGISRSGATISIAVFFKIDRKSAAEFSFLMVLLPIMGIMFLELIYIKNSNTVLSYQEIKTLFIAFFSAFFSGLIACKYMINVVAKNRLPYFGYYCFIIAIFFLIYS